MTFLSAAICLAFSLACVRAQACPAASRARQSWQTRQGEGGGGRKELHFGWGCTCVKILKQLPGKWWKMTRNIIWVEMNSVQGILKPTISKCEGGDSMTQLYRIKLND
jgi:hypothetical protein